MGLEGSQLDNNNVNQYKTKTKTKTKIKNHVEGFADISNAVNSQISDNISLSKNRNS